MDLRNKLLQHKPKVTEIEILGEIYINNNDKILFQKSLIFFLYI